MGGSALTSHATLLWCWVRSLQPFPQFERTVEMHQMFCNKYVLDSTLHYCTP